MKILLVGIGGYGDELLKYFIEFPNYEEAHLCAVVDPYAKNAPNYKWLIDNNVPIYDTIKAFFENDRCDFAIVATPPYLHEEQSIELLRGGAHVLCEKPIAPTLQAWNNLNAVELQTGKTVAVGFQWSYAKTFIDLKTDILSGKFGNVISNKVIVPWRRYDNYYTDSNWKGRIKTTNGVLVNDNIVSNAASHYLHNMLFMAGDKIDTSSNFRDLTVELYCSRSIETFDTAFINGTYEKGGTFLFIASHSIDVHSSPILKYKYEKATVTFENDNITAHFNDGTTHNYGNPNEQTPEQFYGKIVNMQRFLRNGKKLTCTLSTVKPHLDICTMLTDETPIHIIPDHLLSKTDNLNYYAEMYTIMTKCYNEEKLPMIYRLFKTDI